MGRFGVRLALTVLSIAVASPVMARSGYWMHTTEEDPFSGDMHMAVVSDDFDQMAGFRCTKADDLALIFIPVQKPGELADASYFAAASNEIAVIIDDSPKMTIKADVDITAKGDHFRYTSGANEVVNLAFKAAAANKRFAIAAVTNGKVISSKTYSIAGSTKALNALIEGCKIPKPDTQGSIDKTAADPDDDAVRYAADGLPITAEDYTHPRPGMSKDDILVARLIWYHRLAEDKRQHAQ